MVGRQWRIQALLGEVGSNGCGGLQTFMIDLWMPLHNSEDQIVGILSSNEILLVLVLGEMANIVWFAMNAQALKLVSWKISFWIMLFYSPCMFFLVGIWHFDLFSARPPFSLHMEATFSLALYEAFVPLVINIHFWAMLICYSSPLLMVNPDYLIFPMFSFLRYESSHNVFYYIKG